MSGLRKRNSYIWREQTGEIAEETGVDILGRIPIDPVLASLVDKGEFERFSCDYLSGAAEHIEKCMK